MAFGIILTTKVDMPLNQTEEFYYIHLHIYVYMNNLLSYLFLT